MDISEMGISEPIYPDRYTQTDMPIYKNGYIGNGDIG
jgi:hypothetical protein